MYSTIPLIIVSPNFQITQIYTPPPNTNTSPLYNTSTLQYVHLLVLPSGGKYKISFNTNTLVAVTLERLLITQSATNQFGSTTDNFSQGYYNAFYTTGNIQTATTFTYTVSRKIVETLYIYGDEFKIDTTTLPNTYNVRVSLPTYIPLSTDLTGYFPNIGNVTYIYPSNSIYLSTNTILPEHFDITTLYGIKYTIGVTISYNPQWNTYPFTAIFDIPDIYGNDVAFTVNDMTLPNSLLESPPNIPYDFVPTYSSGYLNFNTALPMTLGGIYKYNGFTSQGYADGIMSNNPIFLPEQVGIYMNYDQQIYQWIYAGAMAMSFRGTKDGIKPYGLYLSAGVIISNLLANLYTNISNTNNVSQTLVSDAQILPSMVGQ